MISSFNSERQGVILVVIIMTAILFLTPQVSDPFVLLQTTYFASMVVFALSMAFVWGYGGILCFGQSAFFGLGAYTYAIAQSNFGESTLPFCLGIVIPAGFAALLGYFMFYGRLNDVYVAVITLAVTLALYYFVNSTSEEIYRIGNARLMGFNGIAGIPPINWPGDPNAFLVPNEIFYLSMGIVILTYLGLHALLRSWFGRVAVATREHELRAELLGYDVRLYRLLVFVIGGGIAGVAGVLSINYTGFISPSTFNLAAAAQPIMWVLVGGLGTLVGPMLGCVTRLLITFVLGATQIMNTYFVYGLVVMVFALAIPQGIVPTVRGWRDPIVRFGQTLVSGVVGLVESLFPDVGAKLRGGSVVAFAHDLSAATVERGDAGSSASFTTAHGSPFLPRTDATPILVCKNLSMQFGGVVALNGIDFSLEEGEIRCLIGPNGAGKSTFFKCLTRQYEPTTGHIYFRDKEITHKMTHQVARYGIAIKTQVPSLFDRLSARENIWLSCRRYQASRQANLIVDDVLERLLLTNIQSHPVGRLSHGERQWVELAVVLSANPQLVFLDEPTAGMSHDEISRTAALIQEINKTASLVVVEHDMQFIKSIAKKVTVFHQGKILVEDTMANVLGNQQVHDVYLGKGLN
jgi:branched-chain amino acid transport system permease protein